MKIIKGFFSNNSLYILTTDGVGRLLFDENQFKTCPALSKMKGWTEKYSPEEVKEILDDNMVNTFFEATTDDVSAVLIYKNPITSDR